MKVFLTGVIALMVFVPAADGSKQNRPAFYPEIEERIKAAIDEFDQIPEQRKETLKRVAEYARSWTNSDKPVDLIFICTHNSRRSQMSQVWAQTAAAYYGIPKVTAYSGGTASTAFNPRAVEAVRRAGFRVEKTTEGENPIYHVRYSNRRPAMTQFSKVYDSAPNPTKDFCAVLTCSAADKACPVVRGASLRVAVPFEDPKAFDGTDQEAAKYDERCRQICREMLYVFSQVEEKNR